MPEWPEIEAFQKEFRKFVAERKWDQFHTPKNLAMALAGEVGELLEHFQWLTAEQSADLPDETREKVEQESPMSRSTSRRLPTCSGSRSGRP